MIQCGFFRFLILNFNTQTVTGELLIIVSALSWACVNVFSKVKFSGDEIMNMTAWQLLIGAIILICGFDNDGKCVTNGMDTSGRIVP